MVIKKAGCILLDTNNEKIALVYRENHVDFSFPKGHLKEGETLEECAIRETEEETGRICEINSNVELPLLTYKNKTGDVVETSYFIATDKKESDKIFDEHLVHDLKWTNIDDVQKKLSYENLKKYWNQIKPIIMEELDK